ncbi:DUF4291 domain-containing protein [Nocardia neocaledoniensis]|uniref:DUF4291 domain-containing protein n=1 Tax=Nocardia neocaledoniensis TaxID=236511 RepID=UPI00340C33E7
MQTFWRDSTVEVVLAPDKLAALAHHADVAATTLWLTSVELLIRRLGVATATILSMDKPYRQVRAQQTGETLVVYQAYRPEIASSALEAGRFSDGFNRDRMTWIKPSFLWMMYRSGWAQKQGQEMVLAIEISKSGFEWALGNSALSHFDRSIHEDLNEWRTSLGGPVRVQWDPERDIRLDKMNYRSLQVGLSGPAVDMYCDDWIVSIEDRTELAHELLRLTRAGEYKAAEILLPDESPYLLPASINSRIGVTSVIGSD